MFHYLFFLIVISASFMHALPVSEDAENATTEPNGNDTVPQDLYVIRSVVYEVGILTDASNDTSALNETHEQVDLSFFDPSRNGSVIDLSKIPVPIQTNVSGVSVTGLLSGSLNSIILPSNSTSPQQLNITTPLLPTKQLTVTQNISTHDPEKGSKIISNLPQILGLTSKKGKDKDSSSSEETIEKTD